MKRALVTGATGFLGSHLVRHFNRLGISVRIVRRSVSSTHALAGTVYEEAIGELDDSGFLEKAIDGCDAVFHLAAEVTLLHRNHKTRWKTNVNDLQIFLNVLAKHPEVRFVFCSTAGAVGFTRKPEILDENSPFTGSAIDYFMTKWRGEELIKQAVESGLDAVIVNPSTVIGPGMRQNQQNAFRDAASGKVHFYPPGGNSFVFVDDVVRGMVAASQKGKAGARYILAGHNMTFKEYLDLIALVGGAEGPRCRIPGLILPMAGFAMETFFGKYGADFGKLARSFGYYSSEKAKRELNYSITPIQVIIKETLTSIKKQ